MLRPRPAAGGADAALARREGARLGVALPHRPLDAEPGDDRAAAAATSATTTHSVFHHAGLRARRAWAATSTSCRRRSTRSRRRTWRSRPRTPPTSASSSAIDVDRPLMLPGLALRPVEGPARRHRRLPRGRRRRSRRCSSRSSARWRPTTPRAGSSSTRRCRHADGDPDIKILNNFNSVGAIEVNAFQSHADVVHPEVDARGLRPDGHRGAVEGPAVHRRQRRRHPAADRRRRDRLPRRLAGGVRRSAASRSSRDPELAQAARAAPARSTRASTSSRRATCATTCAIVQHDGRRGVGSMRHARFRRGRRSSWSPTAGRCTFDGRAATRRAAAAAAWSPR